MLNIIAPDDSPRYRRGNRVLVSLCVLNTFIYLFAKVYYILCNRYRDRKWNTMTPSSGRSISKRRRIRGISGWISGLLID